jgi:hypothetical protein
MYQVWSFSPADEHPMLRDPSSSPVSMPDQHMILHSDGDSDKHDGDSTMRDGWVEKESSSMEDKA